MPGRWVRRDRRGPGRRGRAAGKGRGESIGEVDLSHLRVEKTGGHDVALTPEGAAELKGFGDGVGGAKDDEKSPLSELIDKFNAKFGTDFTETDLLPFSTSPTRTRRSALPPSSTTRRTSASSTTRSSRRT
ncbi:hypothetical protein GCM10027162_42140 [Streptomyces incanus]